MQVTEWLGKDNKLGIDIWNQKYRFQKESFDEWLDRVSGGDVNIRQLIIDKKFLFGGRILASRGVVGVDGYKASMSNCYVITPPEDNIESIFDCAKKLARTYSYGGGCGVDISKLSPKGAVIKNAAKETSGAVSFMSLYSLVTGLIAQSGRRGALLISISCDHPDLEDFIKIKTNLESVTKANISIRMTDAFMEAVDQKKKFTLSFIRETTGQVIKKEIDAYEIFKLIAEVNWNYAEPGMLFWDTVNKWNMLHNNPDFEYGGVNPCGEETLPSGGACLLGALNLSEFIDKKNRFDIDDFKKAVSYAVDGLNAVLNEGLPYHPLIEQKLSSEKWRQIGLGIMGLADMLIKMKIRYGSEESIKICDQIGHILASTAIERSIEIAFNHGGPYPGYKPNTVSNTFFFLKHATNEMHENIRIYGIHNSQLLTVAPTGTIATMLQISTGIEPIFANYYDRKTETLMNKEYHYKVYTPIVKRYMDENGITDESDLPDYFVTAKTVPYQDRIKMQAIWQTHIDASISSTVNLPENTTVEDIMDLYMLAWKSGLKGVTVFREGCKRVPILDSSKKDNKNDHIENKESENIIEEKEEKHPIAKYKGYPIEYHRDGMKIGKLSPIKSSEEKEKPEEKWYDHIDPIPRKELPCRLPGSSYYKQTACGKLHIDVNNDGHGNLVEVFINTSKSGGCAANASCIGRLVSTALRSGISVESIVDTIEGVKCSACASSKGKGIKLDGISCGDIIARVIKEEYKLLKKEFNEEENHTKQKEIQEKKNNLVEREMETCPNCGVELVHESGCIVCKKCGYSGCS